MAIKPKITGDSLDLMIVDYTDVSSIDFPCMFALLGNTVVSVVFKQSFTSNDGTIQAVTGNSYTQTVTSFDLVVNGYVISRRRYGNPGITKKKAYEDARNILEGLCTSIKDSLSGMSTNDNSSSGLKLTSINSYPNMGKTTSITNLMNNSKS